MYMFIACVNIRERMYGKGTERKWEERREIKMNKGRGYRLRSKRCGPMTVLFAL